MIENALLIGCAISTGLLAISHLALWPLRNEMHRVFAYVVGCTCLGIGIAVTSYQLAGRVAVIDPRLMVVVYVAHVGSGGGLVAAAWASRWMYDQYRAKRTRITELMESAEERRGSE